MADSDLPRLRDDRAPRASSVAPGGRTETSSEGVVSDLYYVWHAVRRNLWLTLVTLLVCVGIALAYSLMAPLVYQSYSVTLVNAEKKGGSPSSNPVEEALSMQRTSRTMENELERLRQSIPMAKDVVARLDSSTLAQEAGYGPASQRQLAQYLLSKRVNFGQTSRGADVIRITATAPEPQEAARIANAYARTYREHSRQVSQSGAVASREFLSKQVEKRQQELQQAEQELEQFMEQEDAVALESKQQNAVQQIASLDAQLAEARANLQAERSALEELRARIADIEPNLRTRVQSSVGEELAAIQKEIAALETKASDYYAQTPRLRGNEAQNPNLASLERRIERLRAQADSLAQQQIDEVTAAGGLGGGSGGGGTQGLGRISELRQEATQRSVTVGAIEARVDALEGQIAQYEQTMSTLPDRNMRLAQLRRARQSAEEMYLSLRKKLQEASVAEESQIGYVEIVRPALVPSNPISPNTKLNLLLGTLLGLALGVGVALVRQATNQQLRTPDDLRALGFEMLGLVPERNSVNGQRELRPATAAASSADGDEQDALATSDHDGSPKAPFTLLTTEAEAFRHLRTNLQFRRPETPPRVVAVTSPHTGEGKTSVSLGLANVMAQAGQRTLLIDADLRRPAGHRYLGVSREEGLSDLLRQGGPPSDWEWARLDDEYRFDSPPPPGGDGSPAPPPEGEQRGAVYFLPAGRPVQNASELLGSRTMKTLLDRARADFDIVILDTSPLLSVTDPVLAATYCDATLLVAASGQTSRQSLLHARERLESIGAAAPLAGVVLNRVDADEEEMGDYGYDYTYGYGDTPDEDAEASRPAEHA